MSFAMNLAWERGGRRGATRHPLVAVLVLSFACAASRSAVAQSAQDEPSAADVGAARALGVEGFKLAEAGNCAEAIDRLQRAEKLFHAPTTLVRLGECQIETGKLVEGIENLNRAAREALPANAPIAFVQAQERAKKALVLAKPRLAHLIVSVEAPPGANLAVKIDGVPIPNVSLNADRPADPGTHTIEASAPGYLSTTSTVKLAEGSSETVKLKLEVDPAAKVAESTDEPKVAPATPPVAPPEVAPARDRSEAASSPPILAYSALGVGAVGVIVGAVTGGLAVGKKSDLEKACPEKVCSPEDESTLDSARTMGTVSTIGFTVGGVALAAGVVLLLTRPSAGEPTRTGSLAKPQLRPVIGLGAVGLHGSF